MSALAQPLRTIPATRRCGAAAGAPLPPSAAQEDADVRFLLPAGGVCLKTALADLERDLVLQALTRSAGVVSRAARLLRLGRTTLLEKMRKLQLVKSEATLSAEAQRTDQQNRE